MHPVLLLSILTAAVVFIPAQSRSGNTWMMERNRQELLMLNSTLLKNLTQLKKNGAVTLTGSVVYRDGKTILQINALQDFRANPDEHVDVDSLMKGQENYKVFLREESLDEIPIVDSTSDKQTVSDEKN